MLDRHCLRASGKPFEKLSVRSSRNGDNLLALVMIRIGLIQQLQRRQLKRERLGGVYVAKTAPKQPFAFRHPDSAVIIDTSAEDMIVDRQLDNPFVCKIVRYPHRR